MVFRNLYIIILMSTYLIGCNSPTSGKNDKNPETVVTAGTSENDLQESDANTGTSDKTSSGKNDKNPEAVVTAGTSGNDLQESDANTGTSDKTSSGKNDKNPEAVVTAGTSGNDLQESDANTGTSDKTSNQGVATRADGTLETNSDIIAFRIAVRRDNVQGVLDYLKKGGDIDADSLLIHVRSSEMLQIFIENEADLNAINGFGKNAMMIQLQDYQKSKILLEHGIDVAARGPSGKTALMFFLFFSRDFPYPSLRLDDLRESLERIYKSDNPNDTINEIARDIVLNQNDTVTNPLAELLGQQPSIVPNIPNSESFNAVEDYMTNLAITELLLKYEADVNARDDFGRTALMFASYIGFIPLMEMLIENGADLNIKTEITGVEVTIPTIGYGDVLQIFPPEHYRAQGRQINQYFISPIQCTRSSEVRNTLTEAGATPLPSNVTELKPHEQSYGCAQNSNISR